MRERDGFYLACSPIDAPETAVLIAIRSIYIHQCDVRYRYVWPMARPLGTWGTRK